MIITLSKPALFATWRELKHAAEFGARFNPDELHVHIGLLIFLVSLWLFRGKKLAPVWALLAVCTAQALNEIIDMSQALSLSQDINYKYMIKDTARTLFWPAILVAGLFYGPPNQYSLNESPKKNGS